MGTTGRAARGGAYSDGSLLTPTRQMATPSSAPSSTTPATSHPKWRDSGWGFGATGPGLETSANTGSGLAPCVSARAVAAASARAGEETSVGGTSTTSAAGGCGASLAAAPEGGVGLALGCGSGGSGGSTREPEMRWSAGAGGLTVGASGLEVTILDEAGSGAGGWMPLAVGIVGGSMAGCICVGASSAWASGGGEGGGSGGIDERPGEGMALMARSDSALGR